MTSEKRLEDLLQLERLQLSEVVSAKRNEFEVQRRRLAEEHFASNRNDAHTLTLMLEAWQGYLSAIIDARLDIRRNLALKELALATDEQLSFLEADIEHSVAAWRRSRSVIEDIARTYPVHPSVLDAIVARLQRKDDTLPRARNRIQQLKIEFRHNLHGPETERTMKIEIQNSVIHQLNLGDVLGDMNSSVSTLQEAGNQELAHALKALIEQFGSSSAAAPEVKKDAIENLALIGQQATLPPEQRKQGLVKAALGYIRACVESVGPLSEAWKTFGPVIEKFFRS